RERPSRARPATRVVAADEAPALLARLAARHVHPAARAAHHVLAAPGIARRAGRAGPLGEAHRALPEQPDHDADDDEEEDASHGFPRSDFPPESLRQKARPTLGGERHVD